MITGAVEDKNLFFLKIKLLRENIGNVLSGYGHNWNFLSLVYYIERLILHYLEWVCMWKLFVTFGFFLIKKSQLFHILKHI